MANRSQDYQSGSPRLRQDDDERYGRFRSNEEESDDVARAGSYDDGRVQYGRDRGRGGEGYRGNGEQGQGDYRQGSSERGYGQHGYGQSGYRPRDYRDSRGEPSYGANTGQERYGQSGYGRGGYGQSQRQAEGGESDDGESNYRNPPPAYGQDYGSSGTSQYGRSGYGRYRGYGGEGGYERTGQWTEPSGEGQQYGSYPQSSGGMGYGYGQHRGKGPKGFQRSDERIKELISERLSEDPHIDASEITVTVESGQVRLEGTVDSRDAKNAAEDIAEQFSTQSVQNHLRVDRERQSRAQGGQQWDRSGPSSRQTTGTSSPQGAESSGKQKQH